MTCGLTLSSGKKKIGYFFFFGEIWHQNSPKKIQCKGYEGSFFGGKNAPKLPDFQEKQILKSPNLDNKLPEVAKTLQEFFFFNSTFRSVL